jgi:hypothetical protein
MKCNGFASQIANLGESFVYESGGPYGSDNPFAYENRSLATLLASCLFDFNERFQRDDFNETQIHPGTATPQDTASYGNLCTDT